MLGRQRGEHLLEHGVGQVGDGPDHLLPPGPGAVAGEDLGAAGIETLPRFPSLGAHRPCRGRRSSRRRSFRDRTLRRRRHAASIADPPPRPIARITR